MENKQFVLASRPSGMPAAENFQLNEIEVPQPQDGEVLVRTLYLSVDPYLRSRMNDRKSYVEPFQIGKPITGGAVGQVTESRAEGLKPGDIVTGMLPWQLYSVARKSELHTIDPALAPVTTALGVLGMPGLTAYFGFLDIGKPQEGETVVVSGAAGAVGTVVCQIARLKGCRVVGIAGGDEKNRYLREELGVDATINYKTADLKEELRRACPKGIDIYFDNVGGEVSDLILALMRHGSRTIICGQISLYNLEKLDMGIRVQPYLLVNSSLMQGFIVTDYAARFGEGVRQMVQWLKEGKLKYAENIVEGFENTPQAFLGLFTGENLGKQLVKVADL
ncbi:MAG TPA: NADP-dependent oxidoreductase [Pyrinomonadaceae bacterium]|nr:NADP-dependent oxidoreductase [Pyrinomonadaceae bacterium]